MIGIRHMARGVRALLAALVAMALFVAPMPVAQAAPCEDHVGQDHEYGDHRHQSALEQLSGLTAKSQAQLTPEHATTDFKNCCGIMCSVHLAVVSKEDTAVLERLTAHSRLEWADQAGDGVAFPPILGPPRFPV
ncbi:hypothetical protein [Bosea sp. TND4EK4]|uniref:hypothetical protein n=1 Tax=Bosea sp. TND4EK4 TaxID=1907408 RepID=UPI0011154AB3|nr:hypothetical protein [Bosea sp. TND4EK4]